MTNYKRKIKVAKYDSTLFSTNSVNFLTEKAIWEKDVSISYARLAYDTAKAMLTGVSKYTVATQGYARSYFMIIPYLLDEKNGYWAINNSNKNVLRDFSKTSRIGELAQGINYHICRTELGAFAVEDYKEFARNRFGKNYKMPGRLPDYVLCYNDKTYGLLESKGTIEANPTKSLFSAKDQYENGKSILTSSAVPIKDTYASTVSFATSSCRMKRDTKVFLVDPRNEIIEDSDMDYIGIIKHECSKHLCLAGNIELANDFKASHYGFDRKNTIIEPRSTCSELTKMGAFRIYGEQGEVVEFEMGFTQRLIDYLNEAKNEPIKFESYCKGDTEFIEDGTYIKLRNIE